MKRAHTPWPALVLVLAVSLLSAVPAGAGSPLPNDAQVEGWQGAPPATALPGRAAIVQAREACRLGKQAARLESSQLLDEALREDDPLTWYDVTYYDLAVSVFQGDDLLNGFMEMELVSRLEGLEILELHAAPNLTLNSVSNGSQELSYTRNGDRLSVQLPAALAEGQAAHLQIQYFAEFNGCGVLSTWRTNVQTGQNVHTITTQAEPFDARCWWPCKDDTRDKADSLTLAITTDSFGTAVSNGVLRSNVLNEDGTRTFTWHESWPIVTYLVSLCVTEYNHAEAVWSWEGQDMPMHDWSWGLSAGDQQFVLGAGLASLNALSTRYGTYPFQNEKYGHAQYTWGGAMEHQTCTSMGFYNESVVAHELAHQWFGDKITCDTFHHIWLNEGWATYSEAIYFEHYLGPEALHEYMDYEEYFGQGTIYVENPATDNIFDGNLSYAKGSWVVHMLRHVMGEEAFWAAVHAYLGPNEPAYHRTATTDEFRAFMEAEHGQSLEWFFDEWIMGQYYPDYEYFWTSEPAETPGQFWLDLGIIQAQTPECQTFMMPVDCRITFAGGATETLVVTNDGTAQGHRLLLDAEPLAVELDPDDWILGPATLLSSPPATDIVCSGLRLLDEDFEALDRLPSGGTFHVAFELFNRGASSGELQVSLSSAHPDMELGSATSRPPLPFGGLDDVMLGGSTLDGIAGLVPITLTVTWEGGSLEFTQSFPAGHPEALLVDDDGGAAYESWYETALAGALDYQLATPDSLPADLGGYGLVIWFTGDNRRALEHEEWERLTSYWQAGGYLVFTGQDFAEAQSTQDLSSYCGLALVDSVYDNNAVDTVAGGIFAGRRMYLFNGGAGNQTRMDVLAGLLDCMAPQAYYYNYEAGSAGEELWCGEGGLLTLGFGLEGIADIGNGINLRESLEALGAWSRGETAVEPRPATRPERGFALTGAHPNPFNPATVLEWRAERPGTLRGGIYNLAGQLVEELAAREVPAGAGSLTWTAAGRASGLYLARLELWTTDGRRQSATLKLMLLQ